MLVYLFFHVIHMKINDAWFTGTLLDSHYKSGS